MSTDTIMQILFLTALYFVVGYMISLGARASRYERNMHGHETIGVMIIWPVYLAVAVLYGIRYVCESIRDAWELM